MRETTQIRERPILFSGPMVRALLDGRKTQTRRVVRLPRGITHADVDLTRVQPGYPDGPRPVWDDGDEPNAFSTRNPFGAPGDRMWVRETWWHFTHVDRPGGDRVEYAADFGIAPYPLGLWEARKRPSIHMPRWACRLVLVITGVRVERLQDISIDDVLAEGIERDEDEANGGQYWREATGARFAALWNEINDRRGYGWDANPWVWVIECRAALAAQGVGHG